MTVAAAYEGTVGVGDCGCNLFVFVKVKTIERMRETLLKYRRTGDMDALVQRFFYY